MSGVACQSNSNSTRTEELSWMFYSQFLERQLRNLYFSLALLAGPYVASLENAALQNEFKFCYVSLYQASQFPKEVMFNLICLCIFPSLFIPHINQSQSQHIYSHFSRVMSWIDTYLSTCLAHQLDCRKSRLALYLQFQEQCPIQIGSAH